VLKLWVSFRRLFHENLSLTASAIQWVLSDLSQRLIGMFQPILSACHDRVLSFYWSSLYGSSI
jgi:hypothetical protein